jgi:hypothetical protein
MCDPISLAVMALSSGVGAMSQAGANKAANKNVQMQADAQVRQIQQDTNEANARNKLLMERFIPAQEQYANQNQGILQGIYDYAGVDPNERAAGVAGQRADTILGAISPMSGAPAMSQSAQGSVSQAMQQAMQQAMSKAQQHGGALAKVGSFGDSLVQDNEAYRRSGQQIDTVNDFSRGDIGLLSPALGFTGFQQQPPVSGVNMRNTNSSMMQSMANALGAAGGSGIFEDILRRGTSNSQPAVRQSVPLPPRRPIGL